MTFNFIRMKQDFFFQVYQHLLEERWMHRVIVFEGDTDYYTVVLIAFYDEKGYFRRFEMPLPILEEEAKHRDVAKTLLDKVYNDSEEVVRVPRTLWGLIPTRELYNKITQRKD